MNLGAGSADGCSVTVGSGQVTFGVLDEDPALAAACGVPSAFSEASSALFELPQPAIASAVIAARVAVFFIGIR
jgi:hypothetical protein